MSNREPTSLMLDWGTSNVRIWLLAQDGTLLDSKQSSAGTNRVLEGSFHSTFNDLTKELTPAPLPTLMSGMIGSRQGWVEAPYLECPVTLKDLARQLTTVPDAPRIQIVPGVHLQTASGRHDVMRGEEVQIAGALVHLNDVSDAHEHLICLPGTHSKWAVVRNGLLESFSTSMTGEMFAALSEHTILGALLPDEDANPVNISPAGFDRGLARAGEDGGLLHHLFSVRAEGLFDSVPSGDLRGYLSGILIGHEIRDMLVQHNTAGAITIVGDAGLADHYVRAISSLGRTVTTIDPQQATLAGLQMIRNASNKNETRKY